MFWFVVSFLNFNSAQVAEIHLQTRQGPPYFTNFIMIADGPAT